MSETIVWIDPDGVSTTLHGGTAYFVSWNVSGRFSPQVRIEEEGVPSQDGMRLRELHHEARELTLPVWINSTSETDLRTKLRALTSALNPQRGDGLIRVTSPLGDQREIVCRAVAGLEGSERIGDTTGIYAQLLPIVFRAWEPFWQDASDIVAGPWTVGVAPGSFFPFFPLKLTSSEIFAAVSIDNTGDVEAWPVWTVAGPGSSITFQNLTTGNALMLDVTLLAGESATIDTRPGFKTVTKSDGTNLYPNLSATSSLWPLQRGVNSVQISMGGSTSATSVTMRRRHKYLAV